ncbi:MAG: hypothetical protein K5770_20210 [Lachnospiraceae bacterium]|nr:hypothetical protein [Lachnospiraceae bacterium]
MNKNLENKAVNDAKLNEVAGGRLYVFDASGLSSGPTAGFPFEVLDASGNNFYENGVKVCFKTYGEARAWAQSRDSDVKDVDWSHVCWLRGQQ